MLYKTLWILLVSAGMAHVASTAIYNGSSVVRTFSLTRTSLDDPMEQLDLSQDEFQLSTANGSAGDSSSAGCDNVTTQNWTNHVSDEARLFLTGPLSTFFLPSVYTLVCLVSVPLNAVAVVIFVRQIRPMKPAVIYMLNLACADLLFAVLLPFKIFYHFNGNDWTFGPALCRVVTAAFYCNMHCSVLLITCISVDRLLAVVYPIHSLAWRRPRNAVFGCVAMWTLALVGSLPLTLSEQTVYLQQLGITTCHDVQDLRDLQRHYMAYFTAVSCTLFFLPMTITVVCYAQVIWSLRRVPGGVGRYSRRKARAMSMALTVLVLFVVCFTPTNCILLLHYLQFSSEASLEGQASLDRTYTAYLVFLCVGSLNCCLDPLVYYFGSSQCQRQLSAVLRCRDGTEGENKIYLSSRSSSSTFLKSSFKKSSKGNPPINKMDSYQASLDSQYNKLLV